MHTIATHILASGTPFYKTLPFGIGFSLVVGALLAGGGERVSKRRNKNKKG